MKVTRPVLTTKKKSVWETTPERGLLRNSHSGQYYFRFTLHGKQKWVHLDTSVYSVAKLRALDQRKDAVKLRATSPAVSAGKGTVGQLMDTYLALTKEDDSLRPATAVARETSLKKSKRRGQESRILTRQE